MNTTTIAARIKLARRMAGFDTQAQLLEEIPEWKPSRLGNYEAGISTPKADDVRRISEATGTSPCWLMFGDGPIRPNQRDLQAIRHQNLSHICSLKEKSRGGMARFTKAVKLTKGQCSAFLENPFEPIDDTLARRIETHLKQRQGWMDEQHVEHDPLFMSFPDDLRELLGIYSELGTIQRNTALGLLRVLKQAGG